MHKRTGWERRRLRLAAMAAAFLAASIVVAPEVWAQTQGQVGVVHAAYLDAIREDEATRRFVELYLRLAGAVWITVEWIAAVFLALGYRNLRRWLAPEDA